MSDLTSYKLDADIATITMDDGKANVIGLNSVAALHAGLDQAEKDEARAILVHGRPGYFSAGFDMKLGRADPAKMVELARDGAEFGYRLFTSR